MIKRRSAMNDEDKENMIDKAMETQITIDIMRALAANSDDPEYQNRVIDEIVEDYIEGGELE